MPDAAEAVKGLRTPPYQADQTMIQKSFMMTMHGVKKEFGNDLRASRQLTSDAMAGIFAQREKNGNKLNRSLTAEQIADAIIQHVKNVTGYKFPQSKQLFMEMADMVTNHEQCADDQRVALRSCTAG